MAKVVRSKRRGNKPGKRRPTKPVVIPVTEPVQNIPAPAAASTPARWPTRLVATLSVLILLCVAVAALRSCNG